MPKTQLPDSNQEDRKKRPGGRPKQSLDVLPEGWQEAIVDLYSEGASDVEIRAWIAKHKGTCDDELFARWIKEEPEFSATIRRGRLLSQCWWESQGRKNLVSYHKGPQINAQIYRLNMSNRFGWSDNQKVEHSGSVASVNFDADKKTLEYLNKNPQLRKHLRNIARSLKNEGN